MREGSATRKLLNASLILLAVAVFALTITLLFAYDKFFGFIESMPASDHKIQNQAAVIRSIYMLLFAVGVVLVLLKYVWEFSVKKVRIRDLPPHLKTFYVLVLLTLLVIAVFKNNTALYDEDGLLENITALVAFGCSIAFLYLAIYYKTAVQRIFFLALFAFTIFFALEEISYGQRIFGWETSELMLQINKQQESNLHNLFNDYFDIAYIIFNGLLAAIFFFRDQLIRLLGSLELTKSLSVLAPSKDFYHAGYLYLFLVLYTYVLDRGGETMEIIFALTLFFYALDVTKKIRKPAATEPVAVNVRQGSN